MSTPMILQLQGWDVLTSRLQDMGASAQQGAINLLLAIAVALAGWVLAAFVAWVVRALLRAARFNDAVGGMLGRETARHEPAALVSWMTYVTLLVIAVMLALDTLGLNISAPVSQRLVEVVPRILAAAAILGIGLLVSMLVGALTRRLLETAGLRGARPLGLVASVVLSAFTALIALDQLGFAAQFVMALGITTMASVGLACGLAFGLGCRDLARDFVIEYLRSLDSDGPRRPAP